MKRIIQITSIALGSIIFALILTNPSEKAYLEQVSYDYGKIHSDVEMDVNTLIHMGTTNKTSYLLFSRFEYRFMGISVYYLGFGSRIYYQGSDFKENSIKENKPKVITI